MDEHRADGEVLLINRIEQQPSCGFSREHVVARVPIHCIVASSASTYFSALLSPAWHQQESQHQQTATVWLVLGDVADIAAMLALLKCLYTGALDVNDADLYATLQPDSGRCSSAVRECLSSSHWQQLYLRVIKLADQYAVHGVMDVAVSKLTNLFSHQVCSGTPLSLQFGPAGFVRLSVGLSVWVSFCIVNHLGCFQTPNTVTLVIPYTYLSHVEALVQAWSQL